MKKSLFLYIAIFLIVLTSGLYLLLKDEIKEGDEFIYFNPETNDLYVLKYDDEQFNVTVRHTNENFFELEIEEIHYQFDAKVSGKDITINGLSAILPIESDVANLEGGKIIFRADEEEMVFSLSSEENIKNATDKQEKYISEKNEELESNNDKTEAQVELEELKQKYDAYQAELLELVDESHLYLNYIEGNIQNIQETINLHTESDVKIDPGCIENTSYCEIKDIRDLIYSYADKIEENKETKYEILENMLRAAQDFTEYAVKHDARTGGDINNQTVQQDKKMVEDMYSDLTNQLENLEDIIGALENDLEIPN